MTRGRQAALGVVLLAAVSGAWPAADAGGGREPRAAAPRDGLAAMPPAAQGPISGALGRGDARYRLAGLRAGNPAQRLGIAFSAGGVTVRSGRGWARMSLTGFGRAGAVRAIAPVAPVAAANRVTYARGDVREWYENGPLGLEQGFTVARAPVGAGPLRVSLALAGTLRPRLENGSVLLRGAGVRLRYGGLIVTDARGRVLPAALAVRDGGVSIRADDRRATYPLTIDPFFQQAKLVGTGAVGPAKQGYSAALSDDGNTALVGGPADDDGTGAGWIFTRDPRSGAWSQQGPKLVGSEAAGAAQQGQSVALSADGSTALIGGPADHGHLGAAWVFTRDPQTGAWTQQGSKLVDPGASGYVAAGWSVALSADGTTALVGGYSDGGGNGAAWVYTRDGSGAWSRQGPKLVGTGAFGAAQQGYDVALSGDGSTAVLGGPGDNNGMGATWVFIRDVSGAWTQQGAKLVGTGASGHPHLGFSVAVSADGDTALAGGPLDNPYTNSYGGIEERSGVGAGWVFTRDPVSGAWSQQAKLVGAGAAGYPDQGVSVALSADGSMAVVGGPADDNSAGAAWVFRRDSGTWSQQGSKLVGAGASSGAGQGLSVALSGNGSMALVGGPSDNGNAGGTWAFANLVPQSTKLVGTGGAGASSQGYSVALSSDASTAVLGGPGDGNGTGAAWVFTGSGGAWSQQGSKLVGSGAVGSAYQGYSVAVSADGSTALIGGRDDNGNVGAAWVFTRSNGVWTQQGAKLVGSGAVGAAHQGQGVALSADGNTALMGGQDDNNHAGAAWVFTRANGAWTQQGAKLVGSGAAGAAHQGLGVALSGNGDTALIGGYTDNNYVGAAWVFTRSGGAWTQQGAKLVGTGATGTAAQGYSVSLSSDGNAALLGGYADNSGVGAAWVFARSGATWTQDGPKLAGTGAIGPTPPRQGWSVGLSADGSRALLGGFQDNLNVGAGWVFSRTGHGWVQQGSKVVGDGADGQSEQGFSAAMSGDGNTALLGGDTDGAGTGTGAAWVIEYAPPSPGSSHFKVSRIKTHRDGRVTFTVKVPGRGTLDARATRCTRARERCRVLARRHVRLARAGRRHVTVRPGARSLRQLRRRHRRLRIDLSVTYRPVGGTRRRAHFFRLVIPGKPRGPA